MSPVDWKRIEEKWQKRWTEEKIFEADPDPNKKKCFVTFPFPYMNGPLHVGHGFTATRVDVYARYRRMQGYNVLFPWAWHWTGETIAGASERLKQGDESLIRAFRDIDGVPDEEIKKFVDPAYIAHYYTKKSRKVARGIGFSVDWRREFHTTSYDPNFSRFVEWQYKNLKEKGCVIKGTHPVIWCPRCESPTGEADRLTGENVAPEEYVLIKFTMDSDQIPCATFRPETIFGVTNLWINPEATYVRASVNGEKWIISKIAAEKLKEQLRNVKIIQKFEGRKIIGKTCLAPIDKKKLLILPGWFVDPNNGSGVVYSVPAHAPYDWLALRDLRSNEESLKKFGINPEVVKQIKPISLIQLEGFGEYPAVEMVDQMEVKSQGDPKADEATKILYKKEFHTGILKEICGKYAGERVSDVKETLIKEFRETGIADIMYDLPEPVICRCTTPCIVKILKDQWFLQYSDKNWKLKAHKAINQAKIYPEAARQWFNDVIDWFREKACARKTGLGTPLPWSPDWIVETLSDSTVYMAYYTISKYINELKLKPEQLTTEVFDYIFYGLGNPEEVSCNSKIALKVLEAMRKEFLYWYPVDFRNSAKELLPNHLTFFIFHHVALFPPKLWPRAISVNGMLMVEGKKMSKSKGNFVTLERAIDQYGADATRCALLLGAEGMDDPNWRTENVTIVKSKLESFHDFVLKIIKMKEKGELGHLEDWLISTLQHKVKKISENIEVLKTRTAVENAFFEVWNDFKWYLRRVKEPNPQILKEALKTWLCLMAPFTPHICEEIWSKMGEKGFISLAPWPVYQKNKVNIRAEEMENLVKTLLEDTAKISRATKITPKRIIYYTAPKWKWKVYLKALQMVKKGTINVGDLMKVLLVDSELKKIAKQVVNLAKKVVEDVTRLPTEWVDRRLSAGLIDEFALISSSKPFFKREFNVEVTVYSEDDPARYDPKKRASLAEPYRPAIYIE